MNIPHHFDIENKLLSDRTSRCNKLLLKLYYVVVCFLKSFVLIALALTIVIILFKQIGVEIKMKNVLKTFYDENVKNITFSTSKYRPNTNITYMDKK